jgi:hypothetical protein
MLLLSMNKCRNLFGFQAKVNLAISEQSRWMREKCYEAFVNNFLLPQSQVNTQYIWDQSMNLLAEVPWTTMELVAARMVTKMRKYRDILYDKWKIIINRVEW